MGATDQSSQDIALRDIDDLVGKGILTKDAAGGRGTSYSLMPQSAELAGGAGSTYEGRLE